MKLSLRFSLMMITLGLVTPAFAEEVVDAINPGPEEGETYYADDAPMTCKLRVRDSYNVREAPSVKGKQCTTFQSTAERPFGAYDVTVLGLDGDNWVKFSSEETKKCEGGVGYAYKLAFDQEDYAQFVNGECGRSALDGGRTQVPAQSDTAVAAKNSRGHAFPLKQCMGLKNHGGLGHYNAPRSRNGRRYGHTGTDYYAPAGTPAHSPCDGKVTSSTYGNVAGNTVVISCNNGDTFKFMHMHSSPRKAAAGTKVTRGALVGGVGKTGNARGQAPHLHVEAVINGRRVDPQSLWDCGGDSGH